MQTIVELSEFQNCTKSLRISDKDLDILKTQLALDPSAGTELGSGLFKIRMAKRGSGKSSGYRIIYFFRRPETPIILISAFAKNQKINLPPTELKEYRKLCDILDSHYRSQT